jgi:hypothetical protein
MRPSPSRPRPGIARRLSWIIVVSLTAAALLMPGTLAVAAAEPAPEPTPVTTPEPTRVTTPEPTPVTPTPEPTPAPTPEPTPASTPDLTPQPTPEPPTVASILIAKIDNNGTADPSDDVFLDGARFAVYLDDGDGTYEVSEDDLVFGPAPTVDSLLDTDLLDPGEYWIVESVVPAGFVGTDPILVQLNIDPSITCIWDSTGLVECVPNEGAVENLSWTIVIVDNTPVTVTPSSSGGVGGATGTPGRPAPTLPPTDALTVDANTTVSDGWRLILLVLAGALAATLVLTPGGAAVRKDDAQD